MLTTLKIRVLTTLGDAAAWIAERCYRRACAIIDGTGAAWEEGQDAVDAW